MVAPAPDLERFRLRPFVDRLVETSEAIVHDAPIDLIDVAAVLDGNPRAVLFTDAGPEGAKLVGGVTGSRARIAAGFDCPPGDLLALVLERLAAPQQLVEIGRGEAPVQEVVLTGEDADLTKLPVHLQHALDGGPYISSSLDHVRDPETGLTNLGCRRMMVRGRREAGVDLNAPSDLKAIYERAAARGEALPVSFVVGAHPTDHVAASLRLPMDELELIARLRGAALGIVRSVTGDVMVPADAEIVLEGYLDARGHVEAEGPYGEFLGYYGVMKQNPVFHLEAITMREDALFQTSTISGREIRHTETAQIAALRVEATLWRALQTAIREPVAVCASPASGGSFNVRIAMRQRVPGEARNAIAAAFGSLANTKNVFVVDEDIDVFSDSQIDWALATRFQPDRDLVIESGFRTLPLDPSLGGVRTGSKAGYDLTRPFGGPPPLYFTVPEAPAADGGAEPFDSVEAALADGPRTFGALMAALGSRDGREVALALDEIRGQGRLDRLEDGAYALAADGSGGEDS